MNVISIASSVRNRPTAIQLAKDGNWEDTWIIPVTSMPDGQELKTYVSGNTFKVLEFELIFEEPEGYYIFGVDHQPHLLTVAPLDFLSVLFQHVRNYTSFTAFIEHTDRDLVGRPYYLAQESDLIRIGVVNHWFSVGTCQVWSKEESKRISSDALRSLLDRHPGVRNTRLNYQGMSFISNLENGRPGSRHWMKSPCSRRQDGVWSLDPQMILTYLKSWEGFTVS